MLDHYNDVHQSSGHLYLSRVPGISLEQRNEIIIKMTDFTNKSIKVGDMLLSYVVDSLSAREEETGCTGIFSNRPPS